MQNLNIDIKSCPQCGGAVNKGNKRPVLDTCGHYKCRECLLIDDYICRVCVKESGVNNNKPPPLSDEEDKKSESETIRNKSECDQIVPKKPKLDVTKKKRQPFKIPNHINITSKHPIQYECSICKRKFESKSNIKFHAICAGEEAPHQCDFCKKRFVTMSQLLIHKRSHTGEKPYTCDICGHSFAQKSKLKRHTPIHIGEEYVCTECGKKLTSPEGLTRHALVHSGEKPYKCKICDKTFANSSNKRKHEKTHGKELIFMCDECGKIFTHKIALNKHKKRHVGKKSHKCDKCSKKFISSGDLKRHLLTHEDFKKKYTCKHCNTEFGREDNMKRHIKMNHIEDITKKNTNSDSDNSDIVQKPKIIDNHIQKIDNNNSKTVIYSKVNDSKYAFPKTDNDTAINDSKTNPITSIDFKLLDAKPKIKVIDVTYVKNSNLEPINNENINYTSTEIDNTNLNENHMDCLFVETANIFKSSMDITNIGNVGENIEDTSKENEDIEDKTVEELSEIDIRIEIGNSESITKIPDKRIKCRNVMDVIVKDINHTEITKFDNQNERIENKNQIYLSNGSKIVSTINKLIPMEGNASQIRTTIFENTTEDSEPENQSKTNTQISKSLTEVNTSEYVYEVSKTDENMFKKLSDQTEGKIEEILVSDIKIKYRKPKTHIQLKKRYKSECIYSKRPIKDPKNKNKTETNISNIKNEKTMNKKQNRMKKHRNQQNETIKLDDTNVESKHEIKESINQNEINKEIETSNPLIHVETTKYGNQTIPDNPNAINVIKTSKKIDVPQSPEDPTEKTQESNQIINTVPVINAPIKLAFKKDTFKNNYNIPNREPLISNFDPPPPRIEIPKTYNREESMNICQKILSPINPSIIKHHLPVTPNLMDLRPKNVITTVGLVTEKDSLEICKRILESKHSDGSISKTVDRQSICDQIRNQKPKPYTAIKTIQYTEDQLQKMAPKFYTETQTSNTNDEQFSNTEPEFSKEAQPEDRQTRATHQTVIVNPHDNVHINGPQNTYECLYGQKNDRVPSFNEAHWRRRSLQY